jgi:hypothetical protein
MGETAQLRSILSKIDSDLDVQWGRIGLIERWLDDHALRLDALAGRIDASLARIDALLVGAKSLK